MHVKLQHYILFNESDPAKRGRPILRGRGAEAEERVNNKHELFPAFDLKNERRVEKARKIGLLENRA